jgi:hypothetical protein
MYADQTIQEQKEIEKQEQEKKQQQRRLQRIKDCGRYAWWFDPHTGSKSGYVRYCDNFRECAVCLERRAKREYEWMKLKVYQEEVQMVKIVVQTKEEATKMTRGIDKSQYVRYPQQDGTEILFFDKVAGKNGQEVDPHWMREHSDKWQDWVLTPEGRNKSGTMHIPSTPAEEEPFTIVTVKQFVTDAPDHVVNPIMDQVVEETESFRPETAEEVKECSDYRFMRATAEIAQLGFNLRVYEKKMKVIHSKIDWSSQNSRLIKLNVNTKNLTSAALNCEPD